MFAVSMLSELRNELSLVLPEPQYPFCHARIRRSRKR